METGVNKHGKRRVFADHVVSVNISRLFTLNDFLCDSGVTFPLMFAIEDHVTLFQRCRNRSLWIGPKAMVLYDALFLLIHLNGWKISKRFSYYPKMCI